MAKATKKTTKKTTKKATKKKKETPVQIWCVGKQYIVRTVTHYTTGRLVAVDQHELLFVDAAWIADTVRYADTISTGQLNEVEPYPDGLPVIVGRGSIVDATEWRHPLPRKQK